MKIFPETSNGYYFENKVDLLNLKSKAIRGSFVSLTAKTLAMIIQFVGVIILARLLSPEDFGIFAMATVFINIFLVFQDVGLTDATIQADSLNHNVVSTLFWINSGIGLLIAVLLSALGPVAVLFFGKKALLPILLVSSIEFIFYGLSVQHMALLKRRLLFTQVNIINITSYAIGTFVSIISGIFGMRYWALVFRGLSAALSTFVLTWIYCKWRPGLPSKSAEVKKLVRFGVNSAVFYILSYFANNLDKTLIGKKFGSELLGYYSRAYFIAATPSAYLSQSLFHVAVSTLSKVREDQEKFHRYFLNAISILSFVGMPLSIFMVISNKELVYFLLGPKWKQASGLFAILGLSAGLNIIYQTYSWLHVSLGRSDRWLRWGLFYSLTLSASFFIGMVFGIDGIAWAYTISIIIFAIPAIFYAGRPISISISSIMKAISRNTLTSVISGLALWQIKMNYLDSFMLIPRLGISFTVFVLTYLLATVIFSRGIEPLREYFLHIKSGLIDK